MQSICFFNNKGGVGKTTLLANVAASLSQHHNKRVLIVDADPQSNVSQLVLSQDQLNKIYKLSFSGKKNTKTKPEITTLEDILRPIAAGEPAISNYISPARSSENRFGVDLIPGHPHVASLEDKLSQQWLSFGTGDLSGARVSNWSYQLCKSDAMNYDFALFDVGPSLGALNRSVLIGMDFFLTPMGCDIFSLMGIENISEWFSKWMNSYSESMAKCRQTWDVSDYPIQAHTNQMCRFVGYSVQQYITKSKSGVRRPTKAYEDILRKIPSIIDSSLSEYVAPGAENIGLRLPDMPHMYSLVPLAQSANTPIFGIESADGLVGAQYAQKKDYASFIKHISNRLIQNAAGRGDDD